MEDAAYVANGPDRCARCKSALMEAVGPLAAADGATVVLGVNVSDLGDHRPGQAAAAAAGAVFPLVEAGFTKDDIRHWSRAARAAHLGQAGRGLPGLAPALRHAGDARAAWPPWRRPRRRCTPLGFGQLRVRHHGDAARLEVEPDGLADVVARRDEVVAAVRAAGFRFVALDLEGFRSGSLNRGLPEAGGRARRTHERRSGSR